MGLSENFLLSEFTASQIAARNKLDNTPTPAVLERLKNTASRLELVRELLGKLPIHISSGYRSPAVNKAAKGAANSQHVRGEAVDFTCPKFGTPREIVNKLKQSGLVFDQLILEYDQWVHISFTQGSNRKQVLVIGTSPL